MLRAREKRMMDMMAQRGFPPMFHPGMGMGHHRGGGYGGMRGGGGGGGRGAMGRGDYGWPLAYGYGNSFPRRWPAAYNSYGEGYGHDYAWSGQGYASWGGQRGRQGTRLTR